MAISNRGNLYMEEVAPWSAFKKVCPALGMLGYLSACLRTAICVSSDGDHVCRTEKWLDVYDIRKHRSAAGHV